MALRRVSRLVRCVDASGIVPAVMLDMPLNASTGTRVEGCGPWRPGAARNLTLGDDGIVPGALLAPVPTPPAVICIGLNYKRHAKEVGMAEPARPVVFYKNPSSVCGTGDSIVIPTCATDPEEVDYECELAVVIGARPVRNVAKEEALDYVLGYTAANDVSARRWQGKKGGGQWSYSKSFDTFCPLGPALLLAHPSVNPNNLKISTRLNGVTVQESSTSDMIFDVAEIISFLSQSSTLLPGTVILTGTPEGVGYTQKPNPLWLRDGDTVEVELEGVGVLANTVVAEANLGAEETPKQVWSHSEEKLVDP